MVVQLAPGAFSKAKQGLIHSLGAIAIALGKNHPVRPTLRFWTVFRRFNRCMEAASKYGWTEF